MTKFQELLSQHIASSLLKQQNLSNFLGDHNWNVDLETGKVDFGKGRSYPIQIIGTESEVSGTWLWGWANEGSDIPAHLLTCTTTLQELGAREGIEELTQPQIELDKVDGHMLAMVACGVCKANAYYRGPYDGGALFFTMQQMPLQNQQTASPLEIINIMSSVISQFPVNHKTMVQSFLNHQGFQLAEGEGEIIASVANGSDITVKFDNLGRINGMETTAVPEPQSTAKKSWWRFGK
ncbi:MAG TPA: hypothetical protein VNA16_06115 [Abditibacteriaceae bacterium]|nr:hypothetical protein [Abditibacteriaceae bacterium]